MSSITTESTIKEPVRLKSFNKERVRGPQGRRRPSHRRDRTTGRDEQQVSTADILAGCVAVPDVDLSTGLLLSDSNENVIQPGVKGTSTNHPEKIELRPNRRPAATSHMPAAISPATSHLPAATSPEKSGSTSVASSGGGGVVVVEEDRGSIPPGDFDKIWFFRVPSTSSSTGSGGDTSRRNSSNNNNNNNAAARRLAEGVGSRGEEEGEKVLRLCESKESTPSTVQHSRWKGKKICNIL